jgi:hypothetical protein
MPPHAVLASATLVVAGAAALNALGYAWIARARRALRWPLVVITTAAALLMLLTAQAGSTLLRSVEASASAAEVAAAQAHGHGSDNFAIALACLLVAVLATVWGALRPNRAPRGIGPWTGALVLSVLAVATLATGVVVLRAALHAVGLGA